MNKSPENQASFLRSDHYGGTRFDSEKPADLKLVDDKQLPMGGADDLNKRWEEADDKGYSKGETAGQIQAEIEDSDEVAKRVKQANAVNMQGRVWKIQIAKKLSRKS